MWAGLKHVFVTFYKSVTDQRTNGRTDGPTDGRTDRRTDTLSYRDERTHLKNAAFHWIGDAFLYRWRLKSHLWRNEFIFRRVFATFWHDAERERRADEPTLRLCVTLYFRRGMMTPQKAPLPVTECDVTKSINSVSLRYRNTVFLYIVAFHFMQRFSFQNETSCLRH